MKYDPKIHHRRSIRLQNYDYTQPGAYFVTICMQHRACLFGAVVDREIRLNSTGQIVVQCWEDSPNHFPHVKLDRFVVMPNHVHGILVLTHVGAGSPRLIGIIPERNTGGETPPLRHDNIDIETMHRQRPTLGQIVAYFKYQSTKGINERRGMPGARLWQRNYYEHVIRDDADLRKLREYVMNNPLKWELDQSHPDNPSKW